MANNSKLFPNIQIPIQKNRNGFFTLVYGRDSIRQKIIIVLMTKLGERVHLPEFGSRLFELIFEQQDRVFEALANEYVFDAIRRWIPEINVIDTTVLFQPDNLAQLTIQYQIRQPVPQKSFVSLAINRDSGFITV